MQFLNKEIAALTKRKNTSALANKQVSCGIFQDIEAIPSANKIEQTKKY
jgi:hypothetical protein